MPIHDWTRVGAGIFHDFHLEWISALGRVLNGGALPSRFYAMAESIAGGLDPHLMTPVTQAEDELYARKARTIAIRHSSGDRVVALIEIVSPGNKSSRHGLRSFVDKALEFLDAGIQLLILGLFPPGPRDPQGIHAAIWSEIRAEGFTLPADKPLTLVAYTAGIPKIAYVEPVAVGDVLPEMPLFLEPERYIPLPLEPAYLSAFEAVPARWRSVLAPPRPPG